MLELKGIQKDYPAGENTVHALKGIDLKFRKSELVSILGPSGCGKTTMLNIIGGLDQYTRGDLIINGRSTRDFRDRDWDTYRNHSIGFVFQSYNLIPHQTVLQNVELALTLSGVSKADRKKRAKQALEDVGLGNQLHKKPSEMSGGQMQRVAIARALVNNPDIILADEPTGALDTKTSVQIMDILKEVSRNRLVIMVTHNPELAEQYSSRIIRMLDGVITDDTAPLSDEEIQAEQAQDAAAQSGGKKKQRRPSMSFFTGFSTYIDEVQEDALSSYPLTIEKTNTDLSAVMETFMGKSGSDSDHSDDAVYEHSSMYDIVKAMNNADSSENDLKSFKTYLEKRYSDKESDLHQAMNGIQYSYDLNLLVYTKNVDGTIIPSDANQLLQELMLKYMHVDVSSMMKMSENSGLMSSSLMSSMGGMSGQVWQEMLSGDDGQPINSLLKKQYDVVYGAWPENYNEIVLVVDENNELDDTTLYTLGLKPESEMGEVVSAAADGSKLEDRTSGKWTYDELCNMEFRVILNSDCYHYDENTGLYSDLRDTDAGIKYLYDNAIPLKITGIIRPSEDAQSTMLSGSIGYTSALTDYVIEHSRNADAIQAQLDDPSTDVLTGLPFEEATGTRSDADKTAAFREYAESLDESKQAELYVQMMGTPSEEELQTQTEQTLQSMSRADMESALTQAMVQQMGMSEEDVSSYLESMGDDELNDTMSQMVQEQIKAQYAQQVQQQMASAQPQELAAGFQNALKTMTDTQGALYYDTIMTFSDSTYEDNLTQLGYVNLDMPSAINLYASTFENKDVIEDAISEYNDSVDEMAKIQYTDYIGIMMSSVTTIIHTISYVLIAFVAISLIVSSIMIGVITLISVQERTKEIGILRAIGASKREVCSMFNAETIIIGLLSGVLGVAVTYLLCIPINMIVQHLTGIPNLRAFLPVPTAIILVAISVALTLISGLIPSRSAAKKDPVVALRTE